jgi:hypothetical protein
MEVPTCAYIGYEPRAIAVSVTIVTTVGVELITSGTLAAEVRSLQVQGFPAVLAVPSRLPDFCSVVVDVAPGQLLELHFADGGRKPPVPQPELCRGAEQAADAAMATLLTRR